jgi:hypothetical protein
VDVADSQLAMEHLCRLFNINMNAHLSRQEVEIKNNFNGTNMQKKNISN